VKSRDKLLAAIRKDGGILLSLLLQRVGDVVRRGSDSNRARSRGTTSFSGSPALRFVEQFRDSFAGVFFD
jgi:hypothetical protein